MARGALTRKVAHGSRGRGRLRVQPRLSTCQPTTDTQPSNSAVPSYSAQATPTAQPSSTNLSSPPVHPTPNVEPTHIVEPNPSLHSSPTNLSSPTIQPPHIVESNPSRHFTPSPHQINSLEADATDNTAASHQPQSNVNENQETVDSTNLEVQQSATTAASEQTLERSPETPVGGTVSLRSNVCRVSADRKKLWPTGQVSRAITDTFHRMWFTEGHSWKSLLPNKVDFYWQEFKKKFTWIEPEHIVRAAWVSHAGTRYTDNLSKYRTKYEKTGVTETHIKKEIWDEWVKRWDDPDYKIKRQKMSLNRRTEKAGPGTEMSRHTCGSKSMLNRHMTMPNAESSKPNLHQIFLDTHTLKGKPNEFVDERSRIFEEKYQLIYAEKSRELGEGADPQDCMLRSFVEAAQGFDSHYRLYGAGSLANAAKDVEELFPMDSVINQVQLGEIDAEAAATIAALKSKVTMLESQDVALKSKLAILESQMSTQQELQTQVSQLIALVQSFISGSNGGQGCSNGLQ